MKVSLNKPHKPSRTPHLLPEKVTVGTAKGKIVGATRYVNANPPGSKGANPRVNSKLKRADTNSPYAN